MNHLAPDNYGLYDHRLPSLSHLQSIDDCIHCFITTSPRNSSLYSFRLNDWSNILHNYEIKVLLHFWLNSIRTAIITPVAKKKILYTLMTLIISEQSQASKFQEKEVSRSYRSPPPTIIILLVFTHNTALKQD